MSNILYKVRLQTKILLRRFKERSAKPPKISAPHYIVIGATTLLGDLMMMAPLIKATHWHYPNAKITLVVRTPYQALAEQMIGVDHVIAMPGVKRYRWLKTFEKALQACDLAIVPFEAKLIPLFYAAGVKNILSFPDPKGRHAYQIHQTMAVPSQVQHLSLLMLQLLPPVNDLTILKAPYLISDEADLPASVKGLDYIVIHPGAGGKNRAWPLAYYASVADQLVAWGYTVVLTGAPHEQPLTTTIKNNMITQGGLDLCGRLSLPQLASLLKKAALVIGPDTGVLHLARAVEAPNLALLGGAQRELYAPQGDLYEAEKSKFLYIDGLNCRNLTGLFGYVIPGVSNCNRPACLFEDHPCMKKITVEAVLEKVKEFPHVHVVELV